MSTELKGLRVEELREALTGLRVEEMRLRHTAAAAYRAAADEVVEGADYRAAEARHLACAGRAEALRGELAELKGRAEALREELAELEAAGITV